MFEASWPQAADRVLSFNTLTATLSGYFCGSVDSHHLVAVVTSLKFLLLVPQTFSPFFCVCDHFYFISPPLDQRPPLWFHLNDLYIDHFQTQPYYEVLGIRTSLYLPPVCRDAVDFDLQFLVLENGEYNVPLMIPVVQQSYQGWSLWWDTETLASPGSYALQNVLDLETFLIPSAQPWPSSASVWYSVSMDCPACLCC